MEHNGQFMMENNYRYSLSLLDFCTQQDVPLLYASSAAVYGNVKTFPVTEQVETCPISPYGAAKLASEVLLLGNAAAFGFTARCQRYFNVYGPRQDPRSLYSGVISIFCDKLRAGLAPTIFGDGEQTRDFIYVQDVARANVLAATAPEIASGIANICTGRATTLNQLATGLRIHFAGSPAPVHGAPKVADIRHSLGSPTAAATAFGFTAEVPLAAGLATLVH
jgi:UDP-glucose 4-epimerase